MSDGRTVFFLIVDRRSNHRKNKSDLSPLSRCVSRSVKTRKRYEGIVSDAKRREIERERERKERKRNERVAVVFENKSIGRLLWLPLVIYFVEYIRARLKILIRGGGGRGLLKLRASALK